MSYPKCVYHKDYKSTDSEKDRESKAKVVHSEDEHKLLGKDWGDHPSVKVESKKPVLESKTETVEPKPKSSFERRSPTR